MEFQAVGRVVSEKPAHPDAISLSLGRVWCPIKGIDCREAGDNRFVFTFKQESGKRKALEDGPWMFDKELVVVEDYDPAKRIEDYDFDEIPIWVRIFNLPLGMMHEDSAEEIGNIIGRFMEVDAGVDGKAIGKFLRVKIRMKINNPIMRVFTLDVDEVGEGKKGKKKMNIDGKEEEETEGFWCRFEYEFLPEFCYTCGLIGHVAKKCATQLSKGEKAQFGPWLRADNCRRRFSYEEERSWRGKGDNSGGSRLYGIGRSSGRTGSGSGSDSLSWRKGDELNKGNKGGRLEGEEEVTSPVKLLKYEPPRGGNPKKLVMDDPTEQRKSPMRDNTAQAQEVEVGRREPSVTNGGVSTKNATPAEIAPGKNDQLGLAPELAQPGGGKGSIDKANIYKPAKFHRIPRSEDKERALGQSLKKIVGSKRGHDGVDGVVAGPEEEAKRGG